MATKIFLLMITILSLFAAEGSAQTSAFTYQGRLTDAAAAANGTYDFQFSLYDADSVQIGSTITVSNVTVIGGIFTVDLDFGAGAFAGAARLLEIAVKKPFESSYTILSPRQPVTSAPYSVKSLSAESSTTALNSSQLGGVEAAQFVQTSDSRLTDSRDPNPGSSNYIQNTSTQQSSANFNIGGTGTATVFNAALQYNINGNRLLAAPFGTVNTFTGLGSGISVTTGNFNSFYGFQSGNQTTTGAGNAFFGNEAGKANTIGIANAFFGRSAGIGNTTGNGNSFVGVSSGSGNTTGNSNTFLGSTAGFTNTTGSNNTLVGAQTGVGAGDLNYATAIGSGAVVGTSNTIVLGRANGSDTVEIPGLAQANIFNAAAQYNLRSSRFFAVGGESSGNFTSLYAGLQAGSSNIAGTWNSFFGFRAGTANTTGERNSFFGSDAGMATTTGTLNSFFGHAAGVQNTTGGLNTFIGHISGLRNTTGSMNAFLGHATGLTPRSGQRVTLLGAFSDAFDNLDFATAVGAHAVVTTSNTIVLGRSNGADKVVIPGLGTGGDLQLCWNASLQVARCASSLRFKTDVTPFRAGLDLVRKLQPIAFKWTTNGRLDLGLGAETVAEIEPLLVLYGEDGQVEGVKYDRVGVVLLNAVREQQAQIETQEEQNRQLRAEIERQQRLLEAQQRLVEELRALVCAQSAGAALCSVKEDKPR